MLAQCFYVGPRLPAARLESLITTRCAGRVPGVDRVVIMKSHPREQWSAPTHSLWANMWTSGGRNGCGGG